MFVQEYKSISVEHKSTISSSENKQSKKPDRDSVLSGFFWARGDFIENCTEPLHLSEELPKQQERFPNTNQHQETNPIQEVLLVSILYQ